MKRLTRQPPYLTETISRFIDNFHKILNHVAVDTHVQSAEAEKKFDEIPMGAGRIAGPIAFSNLSTILGRGKAVAMGSLTKELRLPPATTNRLVSWWIDNGLADRLPESKDKRIIKIRITDTGRRFLKIGREVANARLKPFFNKLTIEEAIIFTMIFGKLASKKRLAEHANYQPKIIDHFVDNFKGLLFRISTEIHFDSSEIKKRFGNIPLGAGRIAGPIAFSAMSLILEREDAVSMGKLTRELRLPPATTNRLVSWWVNNGLADRLRDPKDKRVISVKVTDAGREFQKIGREILLARLKPFFSKLTPVEITIFNILFEKLASEA